MKNDEQNEESKKEETIKEEEKPKYIPFRIDSSIIANYKYNETIYKLLRNDEYFSINLPKSKCPEIIIKILCGNELNLKEICPDLTKPFWRVNKRKVVEDFNDNIVTKWTLKDNIFNELKQKIIEIIRHKEQTDNIESNDETGKGKLFFTFLG